MTRRIDLQTEMRNCLNAYVEVVKSPEFKPYDIQTSIALARLLDSIDAIEADAYNRGVEAVGQD